MTFFLKVLKPKCLSPNQEELISAYLDGECTADERARVERWLAESAECRQLLDELRALRVSLGSLERHKLSEDLAAKVLARAGESARPPQSANASDPEIVTPGSYFRGYLSRGGWRRLAYPAAAIAAALLVSFFNTEEKPAERQVALNQKSSAPRGETFIGAPPSATSANTDTMSRSELHFDAQPENSAGQGSPPADGFAYQPVLPSSKDAPEQMSRQAPDMAAKPSAEAPLAGMPAAAGRALRQKATPRAPVVLCEVTPAFLREGEFEKLLKKENISYERTDAERLDRNTWYFAQEKEFEKSTVPYLVEATPDQVRRLVTALRQDNPGVAKVVDERSAVAALKKAREGDEALADDKAAADLKKNLAKTRPRVARFSCCARSRPSPPANGLPRLAFLGWPGRLCWGRQVVVSDVVPRASPRRKPEPCPSRFACVPTARC